MRRYEKDATILGPDSHEWRKLRGVEPVLERASHGWRVLEKLRFAALCIAHNVTDAQLVLAWHSS